jgi:hypothetical protein
MDRLNGMSNILIFLADTWSLINTHSADCTLIFRMTDTERIVELKEDDNSPNSTSEPDSCKDAKPPKAMQPDTDQSESADIHGLEVFRRIHYIRTFITTRVELNLSVDTKHNSLKEKPIWSLAFPDFYVPSFYVPDFDVPELNLSVDTKHNSLKEKPIWSLALPHFYVPSFYVPDFDVPDFYVPGNYLKQPRPPFPVPSRESHGSYSGLFEDYVPE